MATAIPVVQAAESPDMSQHSPSSPMPQTGEFIQIPGLGNVEDSSPHRPDVSDLCCLDTTAQTCDLQENASSTLETSAPLVDDISHAPVDIDGVPVDESRTTQEPLEKPRISSGTKWAIQTVQTEWERQTFQFHKNKKIHHFNFLGDGVTHKTTTPPAESLLVAVTGAKAGFVSQWGDRGTVIPDPHGYAVMRNAMKHVDPVIYEGPAEILHLRGSRLREAATGLCKNFYSQHGTWWSDTYGEQEDRPELDGMNVLKYEPQIFPVNGWFQNSSIMDRWDLYRNSEKLANEKLRETQKVLKRQHAAKRKGSPLSEVMTTEGLHLSQKERVDMPMAATSSKDGDGARKGYSDWTVDLNQVFGKCAKWSDDLDDEDEESISPSQAAPLGHLTSSAVQTEAKRELEGEGEGKVDVEPTSSATSDSHAAPDTSSVSTIADDKGLTTECEEVNGPSSQPAELQSGPVHNSITPCHADTKSPEHSLDGLTQEELEEEDREIYGDWAADSVSAPDILRPLQTCGLVDRQDGVESSSESSEEGAVASSTAPTTPAESVPLGVSFCLPIREKSATLADQPQTVPATTPHVSSFAASSSVSFSLPIREKPVAPFRDLQVVSATMSDVSSLTSAVNSTKPPVRVKLPGATNLPKDTFENDFAASAEVSSSTSPPSASGSDMSYNAPSRPSSPLVLSDLEDQDDTGENEQMSPISPETLKHVMLPLLLREIHARPVTDSPCALTEMSVEAWPATDTSNEELSPSKCTAKPKSTSLDLPSNDFEPAIVSPKQMLGKFKRASLLSSKGSIPRSKSFANLKDLAKENSSPRFVQRQSSLPSHAELEKLAELPLPKTKYRSKLDKMEVISEENESEAEMGVSSKEPEALLTTTSDPAYLIKNDKVHNEDVTDEDGSDEHSDDTDVLIHPKSPVRSPYRRPASNTPRRMMGRRSIWSDMPSHANSYTSTGDLEPFDEVESMHVSVEGSGDHAINAINNWASVFAQENNNIDCSASSSPPGSSNASPEDTEATKPISFKPAKTITYVHFIRTKPATSIWGRVKAKVTAQPSQSSPAPRTKEKSKLAKKVKKFLRKGIEVFGGEGRPIGI